MANGTTKGDSRRRRMRDVDRLYGYAQRREGPRKGRREMEHDCGNFDKSLVEIKQQSGDWILFIDNDPTLTIQFCPYCGYSFKAVEIPSGLDDAAERRGADRERQECLKIVEGFHDSSGYRISQRIAELIHERKRR